MGWYIFGVIIYIVIDAIIASLFADVVDKKGYAETTKYGWLCFLFGLPCWILVAALPDRNTRTTRESVDVDDPGIANLCR